VRGDALLRLLPPAQEPITLYGTGSQTRSFCYVDDLVTGMIAMMDQDELVGPVNLGNPGEFTILELATMVKELTGSKSEIVFQPLPQDDPVRRGPDIALAKARLLWEPPIPLRDGLTRTIDYFRLPTRCAGPARKPPSRGLSHFRPRWLHPFCPRRRRLIYYLQSPIRRATSSSLDDCLSVTRSISIL
jgi:hypothetical protein